MAVRSNSEVIRSMVKDLRKTISDLQTINSVISSATKGAESWEDAKAQEYAALMQKIAKLTKTPSETLQNAIPKLNTLAQILDNYNSVSLGGK